VLFVLSFSHHIRIGKVMSSVFVESFIVCFIICSSVFYLMIVHLGVVVIIRLKMFLYSAVALSVFLRRNHACLKGCFNLGKPAELCRTHQQQIRQRSLQKRLSLSIHSVPCSPCLFLYLLFHSSFLSLF